LINDIRDIDESGDLMIIKEVMHNWPNSEIQYFMDNIVKNFKYTLMQNGATD
jgi:hypothetical protein